MHPSSEFTNAVATLRPDLFENELRLSALGAVPTRLSAVCANVQSCVASYIPVRQHAHLESYPEYNLVCDSTSGTLFANVRVLHPAIACQLVPECNVYTIWFQRGCLPRIMPNRTHTGTGTIPLEHLEYINSIIPDAGVQVLPCGLYLASYGGNSVMFNCETSQFVRFSGWFYGIYLDDFGTTDVPHYWRQENPQPARLVIRDASHAVYFEQFTNSRKRPSELDVPLSKMLAVETRSEIVSDAVVDLRPDLLEAEKARDAVTLDGAVPGTYLYALGGTLRRDLLLPYCGVGRRKFNWTLPSFAELQLVKDDTSGDYFAQKDMLHPLVAAAVAEYGNRLYFKYISGDKTGHWQFWQAPNEDDHGAYYTGQPVLDYGAYSYVPVQIMPCGLIFWDDSDEDEMYLINADECVQTGIFNSEVVYDDFGCEYERPQEDIFDLTQYSPILPIIVVVDRPELFAAYR